jgi:hypothetical protein
MLLPVSDYKSLILPIYDARAIVFLLLFKYP